MISINNSQVIQQTQTQKLFLSPQLQNAINILQLSSLELVEKIEQAINENPFLERDYDAELATSNVQQPNIDLNLNDPVDIINNNPRLLDKNADDKGHSDIEVVVNGEERDFEFFDDSNDLGYYNKKRTYNDSKEGDKQQYLENAFATTETLYEHLISQLKLVNISDRQFYIGEIIISSLNIDGYLFTPIKDVALSCEATEEEVLEVLKIIQSFDPAGVGATSIQESLLLQLEQLDDSVEYVEYAEQIIEECFDLLETKKYKEISSKLDLQIEDVKQSVNLISSLEPYPGRSFDPNRIKYIVPDVVVRPVENGFIININDDYMPIVKINSDYKDLMSDRKVNGEAKKFLKDKFSEAKLLLFSIERRKSTLYKVVEQLVELNKEFFEKGPIGLQPLTLKTIAERIEMHESTISRITTDKYIQTPWGIFELKYFFSSGLKKQNGELKSSRSIKEIIKEIVLNEKDKVLTDEKIVDILTNQGIKIARRTVAKYRKSLNIEPSFKRKNT